MSTGQPKRLIEVDLPIKQLSEHARREKSIRHGHISTLHIWWARRPLAACRAVLCASLWPDPADPDCPEDFRQVARQWMKKWATEYVKSLSPRTAERFLAFQTNPTRLDDNEELRQCLLAFIADFADWDNSTSKEFVETSRALTDAAHVALSGLGSKPLVVDPFAGGGSIPLEALRIGADAFSSDLNPIPVLLNKVVLEYVPKYGKHLVDEFRRWGEWMRMAAERELSRFYPKDADGSTVIAYLWARTVLSEAPDENKIPVEIPLITTLWLSTKRGHKVALRWARDSKGAIETKTVERTYADGSIRRVRQPQLEVFEPQRDSDVPDGTSQRSSATCPITRFTVPAARVRQQFAGRKGGATDSRLIAVVVKTKGNDGRAYRIPTQEDLAALQQAKSSLAKVLAHHKEELSTVPNEELPYLRSIFNINLLGATHWGDLFTERQLLVLTTLTKLIGEIRARLASEDPHFKTALLTCLAFVLDKVADKSSSLCRWKPSAEYMAGNTFGRQALPIVWDFCEANVIGQATGDIGAEVEWVEKVLAHAVDSRLSSGHVESVSATQHPLPNDTADTFFTDPPYYDSVPYADLSDFFYCWLHRSIASDYPQLFKQQLAPKTEEIVQLAERNPKYQYKTKANFETRMRESLDEGRRITRPEGIGVIVFAHKTTAAWETMLKAVIDAGWIVVASWPIDTEMGARLRAQGAAALASSVHLVCRPREVSGNSLRENNVGDWRDVLQELPRRIHAWMPRLAKEGVVGADAIFACLGPALEIFSSYSHVEKASGETVSLRDYLEQVWAAVAKEALDMVFQGADASGFEEDARVTAMWLWTLFAGQNANGASTAEEPEDQEESGDSAKIAKGFVLEYDAARKIAQGLGAHLESLNSLVEISGDTARLLPVAERTRKLFRSDDREVAAVKSRKKTPQLDLGFIAELKQAEESEGWGSKGAPTLGVTVLDRVHQCMILFAAGRGEALRRFLVDEGIGRDERFWRLAQVLSYLYPKASDEKRWIDGVLARKKGLGF